GADTAAIRERGHDKLSTYGLLKEHSQRELSDWAGQLVGLGLVDQVGNEYPILKLNARSWQVIKDQITARLRHVPRGGTGEGPGAEPAVCRATARRRKSRLLLPMERARRCRPTRRRPTSSVGE